MKNIITTKMTYFTLEKSSYGRNFLYIILHLFLSAQYICFGQFFKIILVQQAPNTVMHTFTPLTWNGTKSPR